MQALIVLAHPSPASFNAAMARAAREALEAAGHAVELHDLCAEGFDPVSGPANFDPPPPLEGFRQQQAELAASERGGYAADVERAWRAVEKADLLVWQFPLWWFGLPAILKGWVDRVFAMGRAYGGGRVYASGPLAGKRALLSLTTGGPAGAYEPGGFNGDLAGVLRPVQRGVLAFCGFDVLAPQVVWQPARLDDGARAAALEGWKRRLAAIESEAPVDVGSY